MYAQLGKYQSTSRPTQENLLARINTSLQRLCDVQQGMLDVMRHRAALGALPLKELVEYEEIRVRWHSWKMKKSRRSGCCRKARTRMTLQITSIHRHHDRVYTPLESHNHIGILVKNVSYSQHGSNTGVRITLGRLRLLVANSLLLTIIKHN